jgi:neutral ceramidase
MLAHNLALRRQVEPGPEETNLLDRQIILKPGVIYDGAPFGQKFGQVINDANNEYNAGSSVIVTFVSGNPRNDLRSEGTFLSVERWDNTSSQWLLVATDANWETKY